MRRLLALLSICTLAFSTGPSSVFVIHASAGSLQPTGGLQKDKEYTLLFQNVSKMITLGSTSTENGNNIAITDFLTEWKKNSSALATTPAHGALRATHEGHPFASNINIVKLTYTANKNQLEMVVTFLNYMAKQPAMKPMFDLDHPMLVISENALPAEMVSALTKAKGSKSPQDQNRGAIVK